MTSDDILRHANGQTDGGAPTCLGPERLWYTLSVGPPQKPWPAPGQIALLRGTYISRENSW